MCLGDPVQGLIEKRAAILMTTQHAVVRAPYQHYFERARVAGYRYLTSTRTFLFLVAYCNFVIKTK